MPGYYLVEGVPPFSTGEPSRRGTRDQIGFLDFLRELAGEEPAIPKFWEAEVVGLEHVLFGLGQNSWKE